MDIPTPYLERIRGWRPDLDIATARFYALAIELSWAALGLTRNETFWFTAHLGNSREIQFPISQ